MTPDDGSAIHLDKLGDGSATLDGASRDGVAARHGDSRDSSVTLDAPAPAAPPIQLADGDLAPVTPATESPIQQAETDLAPVTPGRPAGAGAAERKRRQRERDAQDAGLVWETADWRLFCDAATLPQKAGCHSGDLAALILKELVDNALDAGASVSLDFVDGGWVVRDDGPGLDPGDVPRLFAVNRPLLSSKRRRLPLRGMLGNGLRVVMGASAAFGEPVVVETRGRRMTLAVDPGTGKTIVLADETALPRPGVAVTASIGDVDPGAGRLARATIALAGHGQRYTGPSSPWWYGGKDLHRLFLSVTPADTTVGRVCGNLGLALDDDRPARALSRPEADEVLARLRAASRPVRPERLGFIGQEALPSLPGYARTGSTTNTQSGACLPFVVEAWASCERAEVRGAGEVEVTLVVNRTMTVARLSAQSLPRGMVVSGCGIKRGILGPKTGDYRIVLSVITPHIQLATDGKEPSLAPFGAAIEVVLRKVCNAAHRLMHRPEDGPSIKDAAWAVMEKAYMTASGGGRLPANARQIMYAARPAILRLTGKDKLDDAYFTQVLLPDYIAENPEETAAWDVVFDSRGSFLEPHTGAEVRLGTIDVRAYLGERPALGPPVALASGGLYPTTGPEHRFSAVLFIEKEGFAPLLQSARIAERFDVAVMSTKGMSTTAARMLLDRLAPRIERVLVLHDFDVAGFSIFGTLRSDGRRYTFANELPVVDLGLRLGDVEEMALEAEPVETAGSWARRADTLEQHGATAAEIAFLSDSRVELNAMPADVFIDFLERKLVENGVRKVVPDRATLERHARRVIERRLAGERLRTLEEELRADAATASIPDDLADRVAAALQQEPELPWDEAVAIVLGEPSMA